MQQFSTLLIFWRLLNPRIWLAVGNCSRELFLCLLDCVRSEVLLSYFDYDYDHDEEYEQLTGPTDRSQSPTASPT